MKRSILLITLALLSISLSAKTVQVYGIHYSLDESNKVAEVVKIAQSYYYGNMVIPNSIQYEGINYDVTSIGYHGFFACSQLTSIIIGDNVVSIGEQAFSNCKELSYVQMGKNVETIGNAAFSMCQSLTSIIIPKSVKNIGKNAFYMSDNLQKVYCLAYEVPQAKDYCFSTPQVRTLYVPESSMDKYKETVPWKNFGKIIPLLDKYNLIYNIDGEEYKRHEMEFFTTITPEPYPTKEGYTFSGWSEIPESMPAEDVTITGSFIVNNYNLKYLVDGVEYKTYMIDFGKPVTPETEPTKEGYTFSGWSEIPKTMPAADVIIIGSFIINKYTLKYEIDGEEYKTYSIEYGASVNPENKPEKEGYTFSGWSGLPNVMPSHDVTVTGSFNINQYTITYMIDGEVYKTVKYEYGATIVPEPEPTKDGCKFSGWSEIPEVMPAHNVTVNGAFIDGRHSITYMVDEQVYKTERFEVGTNIVPEAPPTKEGYTFSGWSEIPEVMPDQDITVTGTFVPNKYTITYMLDGEVYQTVEYEYGKKITPVSRPEGNYETFVWEGLPSTMPAHDVVVTANYTEAKSHKMVLSFKSGDKVTFVLSDKPVLTFAGDKLIVESSTGTIEYLRSDIDDFHFDEIETSVESIEYAGDDNVTIYDMNGRVVAKLGNESFDSAKTYLNAFKQGMYIIKIGNKQTIKYLKK